MASFKGDFVGRIFPRLRQDDATVVVRQAIQSALMTARLRALRAWSVIRSLGFRVTGRLLVCGLIMTLLVAVVPIPIERSKVHQLTPNGASVDAYGLPWFFFVPDVADNSVLSAFFTSRFLYDWLFWFGAFVILFLIVMILTACLRFIAYLQAVRRHHAKLQHGHL